jgi:eukaryotic-like serine/threonine-protein kinase
VLRGCPGRMSDVSESEQRVVAGRYRLRRVLGQGSMGTVWEGYDELLQRPVAVKEVKMLPGIPQAEADELRERTLREARAIAVVSHPNVITLHDVAREGDEPFVVMEYMAARNLGEILREVGPLATPQAATVGYAVAAGLNAAHEAGITHRDVKPGNVLVATDGRVKLTDFGIARNVSELTLTKTGMMLGSPAYIAPEVAAGREVTPAADLWGLGATLFAVVEGRAPYDPDGPVLETLGKVVHGEVPTPENAGPLAEIIGALMVKDPADRASLADVRRMLHPLLPEPGTPIYTPSSEPIKITEPEPEPEPESEAAADPEPAPPAEPEPVKLANDPGPLPFQIPMAPTRARQRRGALASITITLTAVVLFLAATAGGFTLSRVIGNKPILPPPNPTAPKTQVVQPLGELVETPGDAATVLGEQGGGYQIPVPTGWTKFVEQRVTGVLPNSTRVRYVSPDGTQQLVVERFPAMYPKKTLITYLDLLQKQSPRYQEVVRSSAQVPQPLPTPIMEPAQDLTYKTADEVDTGQETVSGSNRVTFSRLIPFGIDLWVVAVTVPIDQEDTGRTKLFDMITPGFKVTG